ncbi:interferon-inducible GTPase 5-like [Platysternon megacephalum]|uniref:Interferon-inducible GTPase 5-like n=1 Tax=Platysternon megacephalum TaxID=55544 RepID=A0A4D9DLV2_9SAUR|nr:interferon-inducible GTPase 5-like [Platysternon megacephalum]
MGLPRWEGCARCTGSSPGLSPTHQEAVGKLPCGPSKILAKVEEALLSSAKPPPTLLSQLPSTPPLPRCRKPTLWLGGYPRGPHNIPAQSPCIGEAAPTSAGPCPPDCVRHPHGAPGPPRQQELEPRG